MIWIIILLSVFGGLALIFKTFYQPSSRRDDNYLNQSVGTLFIFLPQLAYLMEAKEWDEFVSAAFLILGSALLTALAVIMGYRLQEPDHSVRANILRNTVPGKHIRTHELNGYRRFDK